jgi:hypothetical protein
LPGTALPYQLCRATPHGKGFAVPIRAFAVQLPRTAKRAFPVVKPINKGQHLLHTIVSTSVNFRDKETIDELSFCFYICFDLSNKKKLSFHCSSYRSRQIHG